MRDIYTTLSNTVFDVKSRAIERFNVSYSIYFWGFLNIFFNRHAILGNDYQSRWSWIEILGRHDMI